MTEPEQVIQDGLALPPEDRARVIVALQASLEHHGADLPATESAIDGNGEELLAELQRRSAEYRQGAATARPAATVLNDLKQAIASRMPE